MPDLLHWVVFLAAASILLLIPGPSVIYVVTRSIDHGWRGALFSSVGLALGDLFQVVCTAAGISALLSASTTLFSILKYVGAAYLIVLGVHKLRRKNLLVLPEPGIAGADTVHDSSRSLVIQGFLALNPKTALFFLALSPQFVASNAGPVWLQVFLFGGAFIVLGFVTNSLYGCVGGTLLSFLAKRSSRLQKVSRLVTGGILIALGIAAAA